MVLSIYVCPHPWEFIRNESQKIVPKAAINKLPIELIFSIFNCLKIRDLYRTMRVCKQWKMISLERQLWDQFDLKKIFPKVQFYEKLDCETYVPSNYHEVIPNLLALQCYSKNKQHSVAVVTIAAGTTFKSLFAQLPKNCRFVRSSICNKYGSIAIKKSYKVAITKYPLDSVLPGFQIPKLIEITALSVMEFLKNGAFKNNYSTFCEEDLNSQNGIVAGSSSQLMGLFYVNVFDKHTLLGQEPQTVLSVYRF